MPSFRKAIKKMAAFLGIFEHLSDVSLWAMDETAKRLESNNTYSWSPIGHPTIIEHNASHQGFNVIGATEIMNHFKFIYDEYSIIETTINSELVITFFKKVLAYDHERGIKKTFVILDNAGCHRSELIKEFAKSNNERLILIYQPPYSPELNPQENIWNWMKKFISSAKAYIGLSELSMAICKFQKYLEENVQKVVDCVDGRNYFK